ncbi:hypothetical protein BBJ28_00002870 [Nothophytophthora sp. Chile5]|nr:hypothetical protein BBJ28_00002870 [Nothophytophthora sp. Chile5]
MECCSQLRSMFDESSSTVRKIRILKLLGMVCRHSSAAQEAVMRVFAGRNPAYQSLRGLIVKLEQNQSDVAFQTAVVKFLNALLETMSDGNRGTAICEDLEHHGLLKLLEPFRIREGKDTKDGDAIMFDMSVQVERFLANFDVAKARKEVATARVSPGGAGGSISADILNIDAGRGDLAASDGSGNQCEDEEAEHPEQMASDRTQSRTTSVSDVAGRLSDTTGHLELERVSVGPTSREAATDKGNEKADSVKAIGERSRETADVTNDAKMPVDKHKELTQTPESSQLDRVFSQLQVQTKTLDQATNDKLARLLQKIAATLSNQADISPQTVDQLERSLPLDLKPDAKSKTQEGSEETKALASAPASETAAPPAHEPDLLKRMSLALFSSLNDSPSVTKPPTSGRPTLFSGFGDFSLASLTTPTPAKNSVAKSSFGSFAGADSALSPWGRSTDSVGSSAAGGLKLTLPFFQSSRKGPGLGVTPACTPIATASVRKDAKRPVFPSMPSPPTKKETPIAISTAPPPPPQSSVPIESAPATPRLETVKPLVIEADLSGDAPLVLQPPATGTDISKFRKLLSMGAPREAVRAKMEQAGVDPALLDEQQGFTAPSTPEAAKSVGKSASSASEGREAGPDVSKFRKLLSMGAPLEAVKAKMVQAGLDPGLLDQRAGFSDTKGPQHVSAPTPAPVESTVAASTGPDLSKFKKLLAMGAPIAAVKAKMTQAGLDSALLDGLEPVGFPASPVPQKKTLVKDDPSYVKFFKLLSMGAPVAAVKAKMVQSGLNSDLLDTPDAEMPAKSCFSAPVPQVTPVSRIPDSALSNPFAGRVASPPSQTQMKVKEDPQYAKFFKLLSMGAPVEFVKAKMRMAGLEPDLLDTPDAPVKPAPPAQGKVKDDPAYAKFFKLLSMNAPTESVKAKMRMAGLQPELLDTPDAPMPLPNPPAQSVEPVVVKVKDDPGYAKFLKLVAMGAPPDLVKTKMQLAGLQPDLLDTPDALLPTGGTPAPAQAQVKVKDDPAYAKFFKLLAMGAPAENVKAKMRMAGLQGDLLDTPDAVLPRSAPGILPPSAPTPTSNAARRAHLSIAIKPVVNKAKTRAFYWQHLQPEAITGTIWEELEREHSNQNNQDLLTLSESDLGLLELEFPPPALNGPGTSSRRGSLTDATLAAGPASPLASPRVVFLIDRARSNNISIIVKQFKMSNAALREAIMKMDADVITLDRVQGLIKILPTEEEIAAITGFHGDPTTLNGAERVLKELISVPRLKQRLAALESKHQFPSFVRDIQTKVNKIRMASTEIAQSAEFKTILLVVLQVGNKMNHGTNRGSAKGFRLIDLTKLAQLKSVDKSVTLLHYVARMIRVKKGNVVRLGDSLASLYDVQSIAIPELQGDMTRISDITENINVELAAQRLKNRIEVKEESDKFVEVMTEFVDTASKLVDAAKLELDETMRLMRDTMMRFDKDSESDEAPAPVDGALTPAVLASAGGFFSMIYEFSTALMKADRENELKRIRDEKRLKQQELKCATPRSKSVKDVLDRSSGVKAPEPETQEASRVKSPVAGSSNTPSWSSSASLLPGVPSNNAPVPSAAVQASSTEPAPSTATEAPSTTMSLGGGVESSKLKKPLPVTALRPPQPSPRLNSSTSKCDEPQPPQTTKAADKPKPKAALKVPGKIVKTSAQSSASPLKKLVGVTPAKAVASPGKLPSVALIETSTVATESPQPFDASSIGEIRSQLETKHTTNNDSQQTRKLKPEVETDTEDHGNNNSEPASPEKALSEVEAAPPVAIQADA